MQEGDDAPDQVRGMSGSRFSEARGKSHYFLFVFRPGLGQVRGKFLVVRGRSGASFLDGTRHDFVQSFQKSGQNRLA